LFFPDDYPTTKSYDKYMKEKTYSCLEKYYLYPPSKRVNYQRIGNPFPFCPNWNYCYNSLYQNNGSNGSNGNNGNIFLDISTENFNLLLNVHNKHLVKQQINLLTLMGKTKSRFLVPIQIEAISGGGVPDFNSLLCLPSEEDIRMYFNEDKLNKPNLFIDSLNVIDIKYIIIPNLYILHFINNLFSNIGT